LASYNEGIIIRRNENKTLFLTPLDCVSVSLLKGVSVEQNLSTPGFDSIHLDGRSRFGHNDNCLAPEDLRAHGHSLGMITCRGADEPPLELFLGALSNLVVGTPNLERFDWLQIIPFEKNFST
jgi:hypothetical protein